MTRRETVLANLQRELNIGHEEKARICSNVGNDSNVKRVRYAGAPWQRRRGRRRPARGKPADTSPRRRALARAGTGCWRRREVVAATARRR